MWRCCPSVTLRHCAAGGARASRRALLRGAAPRRCAHDQAPLVPAPHAQAGAPSRRRRAAMVYQPHGAHNLRHNGAPPPGVRAQLRLQRQLSTRVPLWHQLEELEGLGLGGPEGLDTALSEPPNSIPSDPGTPLSVAAAAGPARAPELPERAGTAAGALPLPLQPPDALGARRNPRRQLALLQEALCPLTHCDGDLQPHAQPKAQELYQMLLQVRETVIWAPLRARRRATVWSGAARRCTALRGAARRCAALCVEPRLAPLAARGAQGATRGGAAPLKGAGVQHPRPAPPQSPARPRARRRRLGT